MPESSRAQPPLLAIVHTLTPREPDSMHRPPLVVDGPRPAVEWVNQQEHLTTQEFLVLLCLALDSFDGHSAAPGYERLLAWTRLGRSQLFRAIRGLEKPTEKRPALISRRGTRGRHTTCFDLHRETS